MNGRRAVLAGATLAGVMISGGLSLAQMTPMTGATAAPAMAGAPAAPQTNAAPKTPPVPVPEADYQRYGKILTPGTEPSHPLKLSMPLPDVGQFKIPNNDELAMRGKLEQLITMSDADVRRNLENWPAFSKMSLADEGMMLIRIQAFKDRRAKIAQDRAHALGLLTLKPDQFQRFETEYWKKRIQMDTELAHQFQPIYQARENKLEEELFREFSTNPPVPAPPAPKLAAAIPKPPAPPEPPANPSPVAAGAPAH